jgi:isoquinoline 1-oxidoreductase beta subunit
LKLKEPRQWKLVGYAAPASRCVDKVTAQPVYAIDVRLPGMLYAAIKQCPVFGGAPKAVDESAIAG